MSEEKLRMSKKQAWAWAWNCAECGTGEARDEYRLTHRVGTIAEKCWHDAMFTYGIEYGILIAVAKIFGDEEASHV